MDAPSPERFSVTAYNFSGRPQVVQMTGWNVAAGQWQVRSGIDADGDGRIDGRAQQREIPFEKSMATALTLVPGKTQRFEFERVQAGSPVSGRADLGIGRGDLRIDGDTLHLTVHSLGHVATTTGVAVVRDARGREVARTAIPALPAPADLLPKTATVTLPLPVGFVRAGARVQVQQDGNAAEVTALNNSLPLY